MKFQPWLKYKFGHTKPLWYYRESFMLGAMLITVSLMQLNCVPAEIYHTTKSQFSNGAEIRRVVGPKNRVCLEMGIRLTILVNRAYI